MKLFFTLICYLVTLPLFAQKRNERMAVDRENNPRRARLITSFPFKQFTGGVMVVQGRVDKYPDTLNFILDTGSSGISLDSITCARLKIPSVLSDKYIRGIGGIKRVAFANDNTLLLPGLRIDSLDFHINDYELLSEVYGVQIDGIIGYSFLKRYIVRLDFDSLSVSVFTPGEFNYGRYGELLKPATGLIPVIDAPVRNGVKVNARYYFDMGAGLCLLLSDQFVKDSSILRRKQRRRKIITTEVQGLIGKMRMQLTTIQEIKIGDYTFHNIPTYTFDDISNVTAYPFLGGLVGNDLLRRFNVTLNYPAREIFLQPNSHFRDQFDYSYTGLIIYFIDGKVQVTDVIKGSPADKAGFLAGDIVVSVNNNFSNNIQTYRELLKEAGTKATVIIARNGQPMEKKLPIKRIL